MVIFFFINIYDQLYSYILSESRFSFNLFAYFYLQQLLENVKKAPNKNVLDFMI